MRRMHLLLVLLVLLTSCTTHFSTAASPALQSWLPILGSSSGSVAGWRLFVDDDSNDEDAGGEEPSAVSWMAHLQSLIAARENSAKAYAKELQPELSPAKSALWAGLVSEAAPARMLQWLGGSAAGSLQKGETASGLWLQTLSQLQRAADAAFGSGKKAAVTLASAVLASFMLTAMLPAH